MPLEVKPPNELSPTLVAVRTLLVAAGGGGDALGALLIRRLVTPHEDPLVATCAWERLRIDPVPGPRPRSGFTGLGYVDGMAVEVLDRSDTQPPGHSTLPRLVREATARVFLIDLQQGAIGVADQLRRLAHRLHIDRIVVVDIGGDAIATGQEPGLLSPLADAVMLAGAMRVDPLLTLVIAGAGLDGELHPNDVHRRLHELEAHQAGTVTADDAIPLSRVFRWHPTEGSGLLAAAALGVRGVVEMRRGEAPVPIAEESAYVWAVGAPDLTKLPIARACVETRSLDEADAATSQFVPSELDYEKAKARTRQPTAALTPQALIQRARQLAASSTDATHITTRRLLERLDTPAAADAAVIDVLDERCHRDGPLWRLRDLALLH